MSDILADIDAAIEDAEGYVEWHGSDDAAEWHADGSHEPDELHGDYYAYDRAGLMEYAPYTIPYRAWRAHPPLIIEALSRALDAAVLMDTAQREFERESLRYFDWFDEGQQWTAGNLSRYDAVVSARGTWVRYPIQDSLAETVASWSLDPVSDRPFATVLRELQAARTGVEPSW